MADGSPTLIVGGVCFLLAALAYARNWRVGAWLGAAGAVILAGALAARGLGAGRWPLTSEYEFTLAFALATALTAVVLGLNPAWRVSAILGGTMVAAALLVVYARFVLPGFQRAALPLSPVLDSVWALLHVGTSALAYGVLVLGGVSGLVWLLRAYFPRTAPGVGQGVAGRPEENTIALLLDRAIAAGFPLLTLAMIFGMIWAEVAWGRYWTWDLKDVWTLITWLVYVLYWHVRRRPRWLGRRLAWLAVAGLGAILFTFLGVGWLARSTGLEGLHLF
jgi:cytochrome c-type biogenesis protein CcsB